MNYGVSKLLITLTNMVLPACCLAASTSTSLRRFDCKLFGVWNNSAAWAHSI